MPEYPNPYRELREPSQGEIEIEQGALLVMVFRFLKIPMPNDGDQAAVARAGQLVIRRFPLLVRLQRALLKYYGVT